MPIDLHFPGQDDVPDRRDDGPQRTPARLQLRLQLRQEDDRRHEPRLRSAGENPNNKPRATYLLAMENSLSACRVLVTMLFA